MKGTTYRSKDMKIAKQVLMAEGYYPTVTKGQAPDSQGEFRSCWTLRTATCLRSEHETLFDDLNLQRKNGKPIDNGFNDKWNRG